MPKVLNLLPYAFCFMLLACKFRPNVQGKGEVFLQGIWAQDSIPHKAQLLNYTQHQFKFTCDSFYVDFVTHAKVNYYEDQCFNRGIWKEYAKGIYVVRHDTLFLEGDFTKANYKQKISGCYRNGRYLANFKVVAKGDSLLQLENTSDQSMVQLNLEKTIVCIPKER